MSKLLVRTTTSAAGNTILLLEGAINTGTIVTLEAALEKALSQTPRIIIDFSDVKYVSSNGIGVLLNAARTARAQRGAIVFLKPSATILNALDLLNVLVMFPVATEISEADILLSKEPGEPSV